MPLDEASRLSSALGPTLQIQRELGRGGMATVYLARDAKHHRLVALKVLRPEVAATIGVERFLREIQIAAGLSHPHIVPLHDSGEVAGFLFYIMPYLEGESLRDRLRRDGPLPVAEALRLAREVAGALTYAHAQGIVHRDIKPENILLHAGHAVVTDFGIARALSMAGAPALTRTGVVVGTPLYMSPEQIAGDSVDGRSDVYSLGCVLFEMLSGAPPYPGTTALAILASHAADPVPGLRERRADVPEAVAGIVAATLAKRPEDRYPSAAALEAALATAASTPAHPAPTTDLVRRGPKASRARRVAVLAVVAAGLVGYVLFARRHGIADKSIAVLPLVNQSGAFEDQIRSDGMTEALIDALSQVPGLRVPSRTQVFAYRNTALDSRGIGARLQVATLLEGSYLRVGSVLQVSVRLVNAGDGYVLWANTFRRDPHDVFAVQDEISQSVVRALRVRLAGDSAPVVHRPTENLAAYDLYLQGRWYWNQRGAGAVPLHRAIDFFTRALALDSNYARAWAGLADAYSMLPAFGDAVPAEAFGEARHAVSRALALDSTLADVHTSAGIISVFYDWDWRAAAREFDRALALDSTEPRTHLFHAWYYVAQGQLAAALREVRTAQQLNPVSPIINARVGSTLYYLRRYDEAAVELRQAVALDSTNLGARAELARVLVQQHHYAEAIATFPDAFDLQAGYLVGGSLGYAYGMAGRRSEARATERRLAEHARVRRIVPEAFASVALGLGDTAYALQWLERGVRERSFYLPLIAADPIFAPLHGNPRFQAVVRTLGLRYPEDSTR